VQVCSASISSPLSYSNFTSPVTTGVFTRRDNTLTRDVAWRTMATGATPQQFVKRWYSKDTAATHGEVEAHERMKFCGRVPV